MTVNEAIALAARLESIVRRADTFGPKTREEIMAEVKDMARDLRDYADRLDAAMERELGYTEAA